MRKTGTGKKSNRQQGTKNAMNPEGVRDESAQLNALIIEHAAEGICLCHNTAEHPYVNFTIWNNRMREITGYTMDEINRSGWYQTVYPDPGLQGKAIERMERIREGDNLKDEVWEITRKDREKRAVAISTSVIRTEKGSVYVLAFMDDITGQKHTEEKLKKQFAFLETLLNTIPNPVFYKDIEGKYLGCNEAFEQFTGRGKEDIIGKTVYDMEPKAIADKFSEQDKELFRNPGIQAYEWKLCDKNGKPRHLLFNKGTFNDIRGSTAGLIGIIADISERKKAEDSLKKTYDQILLRQNAMLNLSEDLMREIEEREQIEVQLRESERILRQYRARLSALASQIALIDEEERRRFANELHDFTGQNLALAKIKLSELESMVYDRDMQGRLTELHQLIEKSVESTRSLTFELSPPILYELGFEAAAEWLGEQIFRQHKIAFRFEDDNQPKPLSDETKVLLYLSLRELIVNVVKHAQARNATLSVCRKGNRIHVSLTDNGIGFDASDLDYQIMKATSFGIFSTKERLERLGGKLKIISKPGKGSTATMVAPLKG